MVPRGNGQMNGYLMDTIPNIYRRIRRIHNEWRTMKDFVPKGMAFPFRSIEI